MPSTSNQITATSSTNHPSTHACDETNIDAAVNDTKNLICSLYPTFVDWTNSLTDTQKQNMRHLIHWISFASYRYGITSHSEFMVQKDSRTSMKEDVQMALHGNGPPYFPVFRHVFVQAIQNYFLLHPITSNEDDLYSIYERITRILLSACHNEKDQTGAPAYHTSIAKALLQFFEPDSPQEKTCEPMMDMLNNKCNNFPYQEWPPECKSFIFFTNRFTDANFRKFNFADIKIYGSNGALRCDFTEADLRKSHIEEFSFTRCNMQKVKLNGSCVVNTTFVDTDLRKADLSGANIEGDFCDANFEGAILDGAKLSITPDLLKFESHQLRDRLLNHLHHENKKDLLTAIHSIDEKYAIQKLDLMSEVIDGLNRAIQKNVYIGDIDESVQDILFKTPGFYSQRPVIAAYINRMIDLAIDTANTTTKPIPEAHLSLLMTHALEKLKEPNWAIENSVAINRLLHHAETAKDLDNHQTLAAQAKLLREGYMRHPDIAPLSAKLQETFYVDACEPGYFILVSKGDSGHVEEALIFSEDLYKNYFLDKNNSENISLHNLFWYQGNPKDGYQQMNILPMQTFKKFSLFRQKYCEIYFRELPQKFLPILQLGNYENRFIEALSQRKFPMPLISDQDQQAFKNIFHPLIQFSSDISTIPPSVLDNEDASINESIKGSLLKDAVFIDRHASLTDQHFEAMIKRFDTLLEDPDPQKAQRKQATFLFSLSIIFVRYNSDYFFGKELNSPDALRQYAVALLNTARALDPNLFKAIDQEDQSTANTFDDYMQRLAGINDGYTCTQVLSTKMLDDAKAQAKKDPVFQQVFSVAYPNAWL